RPSRTHASCSTGSSDAPGSGPPPGRASHPAQAQRDLPVPYASTVTFSGATSQPTWVPPPHARRHPGNANRSRRAGGAQHGRGQDHGGGPVVQRGWSADSRAALFASGNHEALDAGDLAMEVTRIQRNAPDGFVHCSELTDGELRPAERGRQGRVLQLGPGPLDGVAQDDVVV